MVRPYFWRNVLRALGAVPVHDRELLGASGIGHQFREVGVHLASGWTVAVLDDTDERTAALVHHDVSAASTTPVLLVRPVSVDFPALMAHVRQAGLEQELSGALGSPGARISEPARQAIANAWREHVGRNAGGFPVSPRERLVEVLRGIGGLQVRMRARALEVRIPDREPELRVAEGIWDFPLYLLTDEQIDTIARETNDDATRGVLELAGIRSPLPPARDASPGLLLNRHRSVSPA